MRPRFNIRDLCWAILVVAVCLGWYENAFDLKRQRNFAIERQEAKFTTLELAVVDSSTPEQMQEIQERVIKYGSVNWANSSEKAKYNTKNLRDQLYTEKIGNP